MQLLQLMNLLEKYPGKISLQDVHAIDKVSPNKCTNIADLPWVILRKIISVDSSFRDEVLEELFEKMQDDSEVIPKSDDEKDNKGTIDEERISLFSLHPSDVFFTIFLCCDMFLQKTIMTKLSFCQFAVPFVYPRIYDDSLMMSLWSLRDIYIDDVQSLPTSSTKRVSFIRLGEVNEQSKSKLIDEFLRDQNEEHSTFYHHDCPLGENLRLVSNGIIEMSWFIPSIDDKKWAVSKEGAGENKSLTEPTLVFNLRGDGALHVRQVQILSEVTDIMVVLAEVESMDDEKNCDMLREIHRNTFIILLVSSKIKDNKTRDKIANTYRESLKTDEEKTSVLFLFDNKKKKNASKRRTMLRSEVQSMMKKVKPPKPLEQICSKLKLKINIDEMVLDCQKGKEFADSLFKTVIKDEESIEPRKEILPLQGDDLWVKWSHLLKEKSRIKTNVEGKTTDEPEYREMESIRLKQIETCHPFMARFIEVIFTLRKNKRTLLFFLDWTKHILEMLSKLKLPSLEKSFSEAFEKYEKSRSESDKSNVQKKKRELRDALFGIEHIFLELSQIYESFIRQGEKKDTFIAEKTMIILTAIPHIVSDLFLSGQILQILDGEASNVPLTWLQSVFDCIRLRKGNVKFTSVSILGIQSSGKSTLLNSMFGIQFNVSAGRCTRGVYTQLIPVRSKSTLKSDYLMVIDTEGLRAPELSDYSFNHDNELATFAIGFGDFALINIKGETISDMKDVLEIVVHGLLRLKQANQSLQFNQSCTFIHQNVSAKDAKDKMLQGHQETLKTLDDITKEIAESEGIQGVNAFKDVLEFHPHSSIKYVPDLWHGSPPMAPTSTKYSSKVQEIVDLIKLKMTETRNIHSVLDTSTRLHDLWKGILKEDFVFSFRNSLEVKAYNSLDIEFKKLGWEMEVAKQEWIDTNVVKGLNDLQRKEDLPKLISDLRIQFLFQMDKISQETKEKVSKFINEADSREQMIHWKERVIKRVDTLREELEIDYDKRVQEKSNICIVNFSEKSILSVNEKIINEKAQDLAKTLQRKQLSEDKLREYFEDMFEARMQEIEKENPSLPKEAEQNIEVGMRQDITTVLRHSYSNYSEKIRSQLQKRPLTGEEEYTTLADIFSNTTQTQTSSPWHLSWSWPFSDKKKKVWKTNVAHILNDIEFRINRERATRFRLSKTEFSIILKHAQDLISTSNQRKHDLNININVEIDIAVLVSRRCYHVFVRHNKEVLQQNSLRNKLGKIKEKTFKRFTNTVRQKHKDLTAADLLSDDLAEIIWNKMVQESKMQLKTWILRRYNFSKFNLMKDLLTKLVEKSYFESFVEFIKFPASYVLRFIITEAQQDFLERKGDSSSCKFKDWAYSFVSEKIDYIITTLDSYCKISENESPDTWLSEFAEALSEAKFDLSNDPLLQLKDFAITDFVQFKKSVTEHLYAKQNLLYEKISSFDLSDMEEIDDSPFEKAFSVLWGCTEKCPLCAEPCSRETKHEGDIKHRCVQHRPGGIFGVYWTHNDTLVERNCNFHLGSNGRMVCCGKRSWCRTCPKETDCEEVHFLHNYNKYIPDWDIQPQADTEGSKFWNWFMCKYSKELAEHFDHKEAGIPSSWRDIAEDDALKSLNETYQTKL
ncbi:hypothetical protein FSP39_014091 [Pinctada imbricata]|uniref:VLIG-type G domain-containing protein n=1 Tax=Pinctada imbricata TaxID=66713 RepID=A0AA89BR57_PINIB|nr:hypothetical protein FSP39_014091 [Pinctada imbricata]